MADGFWLLRDFLDSGGWVLWSILLVTVLLWTLMLERLWFLARVFPGESVQLQQKWLSRVDRTSQAARHIRTAVTRATASDALFADGAGIDCGVPAAWAVGHSQRHD